MAPGEKLLQNWWKMINCKWLRLILWGMWQSSPHFICRLTFSSSKQSWKFGIMSNYCTWCMLASVHRVGISYIGVVKRCEESVDLTLPLGRDSLFSILKCKGCWKCLLQNLQLFTNRFQSCLNLSVRHNLVEKNQKNRQISFLATEFNEHKKHLSFIETKIEPMNQWTRLLNKMGLPQRNIYTGRIQQSLTGQSLNNTMTSNVYYFVLAN